MNECCEQTFINVLEEIIFIIKVKKIEHIHHLIPVIQKAIDVLKDKEKCTTN